ncbi:uncharacterized protein MELLADRAFT_108202 [Melampsora larici-populina 98AG31]|uniref:Uncharacterized protein n=1 Tax=Melampsora larici-populina (strain 98AG31 / pathotype 3-4-7) TaxID=747676 RepID=F4RSB1_MELLP|nr:uncharacterized protein MELLADRAFT_108202 [Melampsora larici-populina 98AG31]EGG04722.1 hypothetical protein MELLADRAFT_108202 [Melampsora larici-populina 98AG31]
MLDYLADTYEDKAKDFLVKLKSKFNPDIVLERVTCLTGYLNEFMLPKSGINTLEKTASYKICFYILLTFLKETQQLKSLEHIKASLSKFCKTSIPNHIKDLGEKWSVDNLLKLYTYKIIELRTGNVDFDVDQDESTRVIIQFQDYMNKRETWSLDLQTKLLQFWTPRMNLFGIMQKEINWWPEIDKILVSEGDSVIHLLDCLEARVKSLNQTNPNLEAILESYLKFLHEFCNYTSIEDHALHAFFTQVDHPRLGSISCGVIKSGKMP